MRKFALILAFMLCLPPSIALAQARGEGYGSWGSPIYAIWADSSLYADTAGIVIGKIDSAIYADTAFYSVFADSSLFADTSSWSSFADSARISGSTSSASKSDSLLNRGSYVFGNNFLRSDVQDTFTYLYGDSARFYKWQSRSGNNYILGNSNDSLILFGNNGIQLDFINGQIVLSKGSVPILTASNKLVTLSGSNIKIDYTTPSQDTIAKFSTANMKAYIDTSGNYHGGMIGTATKSESLVYGGSPIDGDEFLRSTTFDTALGIWITDSLIVGDNVKQIGDLLRIGYGGGLHSSQMGIDIHSGDAFLYWGGSLSPVRWWFQTAGGTKHAWFDTSGACSTGTWHVNYLQAYDSLTVPVNSGLPFTAPYGAVVVDTEFTGYVDQVEARIDGNWHPLYHDESPSYYEFNVDYHSAPSQDTMMRFAYEGNPISYIDTLGNYNALGSKSVYGKYVSIDSVIDSSGIYVDQVKASEGDTAYGIHSRINKSSGTLSTGNIYNFGMYNEIENNLSGSGSPNYYRSYSIGLQNIINSDSNKTDWSYVYGIRNMSVRQTGDRTFIYGVVNDFDSVGGQYSNAWGTFTALGSVRDTIAQTLNGWVCNVTELDTLDTFRGLWIYDYNPSTIWGGTARGIEIWLREASGFDDVLSILVDDGSAPSYFGSRTDFADDQDTIVTFGTPSGGIKAYIDSSGNFHGGSSGGAMSGSDIRDSINTYSGNSVGDSCEHSIILFGDGNTIQDTSKYSAIVSGNNNKIVEVDHSGIFTGYYNYNKGNFSVILGGYKDTIYSTSEGSAIIAGNNNKLYFTNNFIGAGASNAINSTQENAIVGGYTDSIIAGTRSLIGAGANNKINALGYSAIIGGQYNQITSGGYFNSIAGGFYDTCQYRYSFIGAGYGNRTYGNYNGIIGGRSNKLTGGSGCDANVIIGGKYNEMTQYTAKNNVILGGYGNEITANTEDSCNVVAGIKTQLDSCVASFAMNTTLRQADSTFAFSKRAWIIEGTDTIKISPSAGIRTGVSTKTVYNGYLVDFAGGIGWNGNEHSYYYGNANDTFYCHFPMIPAKQYGATFVIDSLFVQCQTGSVNDSSIIYLYYTSSGTYSKIDSVVIGSGSTGVEWGNILQNGDYTMVEDRRLYLMWVVSGSSAQRIFPIYKIIGHWE